ncbi:hypothetical protein FRC00_000791, partial [Tulasnella sp. 408]
MDDVEPGVGIVPMPVGDEFEAAGEHVTVAARRMLRGKCCYRAAATSSEHHSSEQSLPLTPENGSDTSFPSPSDGKRRRAS